jgi:hypothetical protein
MCVESKMDVTKSDLNKAVEQNIISEQQASTLFEFLVERSAEKPSFNFTHVLYYVGGLIAIGAMTLFMNLGFESFGGLGISFIALLYFGIALKLTQTFSKKILAIPAGICATFAICMTPLAVYGLQLHLGVWPDENIYRDYHRQINWNWLYMELATLAVGTVLARRYKYPFLIMPIAVTLWYLTMDIASFIAGEGLTWEMRGLVSLYLGLLMTFLALWVDIRSRHTLDYGFWLYLFGVIAFWGGLSSQHSDSELSKFLYFCINLVLIGIGVLLVRRIFVIVGALGSCGYLGYLASNVFQDSWLFPVTLTGIGLGVIYAGILWQKHEAAITQKTRKILPNALRELLESKQ